MDEDEATIEDKDQHAPGPHTQHISPRRNDRVRPHTRGGRPHRSGARPTARPQQQQQHQPPQHQQQTAAQQQHHKFARSEHHNRTRSYGVRFLLVRPSPHRPQPTRCLGMDRTRFTSDVRPYAETPHAPHWAVGVSYVPRSSTRRIPRPKIHTSLTLVTLFPSSCRHCSPRHTLRRALACPPDPTQPFGAQTPPGSLPARVLYTRSSSHIH